MKRLFLLSIAATLMLYACGSRDAEYYTNHPAEAEACSRMSEAEKLADKECTAVINADSKRFFKGGIKRPLQGSGNGPGAKQY
ncbi:MAG: hypothetical protein GXY80_15550 [Syntrophorhabdus aromaticivorans]|uniref:Entry exclusion lipoprotein TrbK n=1 Tax=Syntrophorhabdus aromaticivorans TaxID=328301 RepID=A0A971S328_9BACT|nr:hypothetical protein [Syntrophorhabdus aromaticivorans]